MVTETPIREDGISKKAKILLGQMRNPAESPFNKADILKFNMLYNQAVKTRKTALLATRSDAAERQKAGISKLDAMAKAVLQELENHASAIINTGLHNSPINFEPGEQAAIQKAFKELLEQTIEQAACQRAANESSALIS